MTPKVKAQKTRLSNYLVKELGAKFKKSQSTESEYYQLGSLNIRISDHTTRKNNKALNIFPGNPDPFFEESEVTFKRLTEKQQGI